MFDGCLKILTNIKLHSERQKQTICSITRWFLHLKSKILIKSDKWNMKKYQTPGRAAIYSHYLSLCVNSIGRLKSKDEQECPCESKQITLLQPARRREWGREGGWVDGGEARFGSMAPDQWSIAHTQPIHFLLTLGALVTQMKMGGQGQSVMMIYVRVADVLFWREIVWWTWLNVSAWTLSDYF